MKGSNVHVKQSTCMLWLDMYHISPQEEMLLSADIGGTNPHTIMRAAARIDEDNILKTDNSVIDISKEESVQLLCNGVRDAYSELKEVPIVVSY